MTTILIVYLPTKIISEKIMTKILNLKLSSCISISKNIKIIHIYKKKICKENEYKLIIKTKKFLIKKLKLYIKNTYFYNEIIVQ